MRAFELVGFGLLLYFAAHAGSIVCDTTGWGVLFSRAIRPRWRALFWSRWVGESVNSLLPVAQVGGDLLRARLAARVGASAAQAGATVIVDLGAGLIAQVGFVSLAVVLVLAGGAGAGEVGGLVVALALLLLLAGAVALLSVRGMFSSVVKLGARVLRSMDWSSPEAGAAKVDSAVRELYTGGGPVARSVALRMAARVTGALELWLGLYLLGVPASFADAFILHQLTSLARTLGFAVPGALGVQEGGFLMTAYLLELPPDAVLALALMRRARELVYGLPGLVSWIIDERRRLATVATPG